MFTLKHKPNSLGANKSKGFTIVELLIVIVVIGILATLVIVTFSGIQQKGRNSQRQTDINAVQSHIAAFQADKGYYPTLLQLKDAAWVAANLKGLDAEALRDPKQAVGGTISNAASGTQYGYSVTTDTNGVCASGITDTSDGTDCTKYTLTAKLEGKSPSDENYSKSGN
jgi:prepilin-type N-terminal cleavage/methylation domain-containing protein